MGWSLLKTYKHVPNDIPFEKQFGMAFLAAIVGYISVKKAKIAASRKNLEKLMKNGYTVK